MISSRILGGLTQGQSDYIRKGVSKKKYDLMNKWMDLMIYGSEKYKEIQAAMTEQFPYGTFTDMKNFSDMKAAGVWVDYDYDNVPYVEGALARGYDLETLLEMKKQWIAFGSYCFNKAHSACYAKLSIQTAWLKAYYPAEFMATLLSLTVGKKDGDGDNKQLLYISKLQEMGISLHFVDVNTSANNWLTNGEQKAIKFGLSSIAKITDIDFETIKQYRPFSSFKHFLECNVEMKLKKDKVDALIKAGAFDSLNQNRNKLLYEFYTSRGETDVAKKFPQTTSKRQVIEFEREVFGSSVSVKSRWEQIPDGKQGTSITGRVTMFEEWTSSKGKTHGRGIIATNEEPIHFVIWGFRLNQDNTKEKLTIGNTVTLKGDKSKDDLVVTSTTFKAGVLNGEFIQDSTKELQPI